METNNEHSKIIENKDDKTQREFAESLANTIQAGNISGKNEEQIKKEVEESLTPEQQEYIESHKEQILEDDKTAYPKPRHDCKHCYGRGYEGWFSDGKVKLCRWITNNFGRFTENEEKLMSLGELNKILTTPKPVWKKKKMSKKKRHRLEVAAKRGL